MHCALEVKELLKVMNCPRPLYFAVPFTVFLVFSFALALNYLFSILSKVCSSPLGDFG